MDPFTPEIQLKVDHFVGRVCSMVKLNDSLFRSDLVTAIQKWEESSHQIIANLFILQGAKQQKEIKKIFDILKKILKEQIPSKEMFQEVTDAMELGLDSMFNTQPSLFT
jgi:hypothetical protein